MIRWMVLLISLAWGAPSLAANNKQWFDIPAGSASAGLQLFARQANREILFPDKVVKGINSAALKGEFEVREALEALLRGTGLRFTEDHHTGAFSIRRPHGKPVESDRVSDSPVPRGSVRGLAVDPRGKGLPGVTIQIDGLKRSTVTDWRGAFVLRRVPFGLHRMTFTSDRMRTQWVQIEVAAEVAVCHVTLEDDVSVLSPMVVKSDLGKGTISLAEQRAFRRQAMALSQQRTADSIRVIASADRFGNVMDSNVASLLVKQPGVSGEQDESDIYNISIRGMGAGLNSVAVDGTRLSGATTRDAGRAFEIDKISIEPIESVEIIKAATPDMDADAIGGTINFVTKSAFDFETSGVDYSLGINHHYNRRRSTPVGSFVYADLLGESQRIGLLLSGAYSQTFGPRQSLKMGYAGAELARPAPLTDFQISDDDIELDRAGLSARVDFAPNSRAAFYINAMGNHYQDEMGQHKQRMRRDKGIATSPDDIRTAVIGGRYDYILESRIRSMETLRLATGGRLSAGTWDIDYELNHSSSLGLEERKDLTLRFHGVNYVIDKTANTHFPSLELTGGVDPSNYDNGFTDSLSRKDYSADETVTGAHFNVKRRIESTYPLTLKAGLRYRTQEKIQERAQDVWKYVGPDGVAGPNGALGNDDNLNRFRDERDFGLPIGGRYAAPPWPDLEAIHRGLDAAPQLFFYDAQRSARNDLREDGEARESIYATYLQASVTFGGFSLLGGARVERTEVSATGPWLDEAEISDRKVTRRTDYATVLPSVHLIYRWSERTQLRGSYSTGIGRPAFDTLMPITTIDTVNASVVQNNTALEPQRATNLDLSFEHYFPSAGLFTVGVFGKRIADYAATFTRPLPGGPDNGFGGLYEGFDYTTQLNGGRAEIFGVEMNYRRQFSALPGWLRGFGIYGNYTRLWTRGDNGTAPVRMQLDNFTPLLANGGIYYSHKKIGLQVQVNHVGERLISQADSEADWVFREARTTVDLGIKYHLNPKLGVFLDVFNVFNEKNFTYQGLASRPASTQVYGVRMSAGITGRF